MRAPMSMQKLRALVLPEGVLLVAAAMLLHWGVPSRSPSAALLVRVYPLVVLVTGTLLAWRFRRGRLMLAFVGLALADRAMAWLAPFDSGGNYAGPVIVRTVVILLPATLAVLAFVGDRGLLTSLGVRRLVVVGAETAAVMVVWLVSSAYPETTTNAFNATFLPVMSLDWLPLGQPAALVALMAIAALVARTLWRPDAESRGLLWVAIGVVIAASAGPAAGRSTLHLANAGFVLIVSTLESVYAMAYHDELTGMPARRALNEALLGIDGEFSIAMVDIDHFKSFNDAYGHDVGDQVLRMVAARLRRVAGGGRAFRYGGEEFAVLFRGKTAEESVPHLDALRTSVADASFTLRGPGRPRRKPKSPKPSRPRTEEPQHLSVTVSIGTADSRESEDSEGVITAADQALYRAKEAGRNRVEM